MRRATRTSTFAATAVAAGVLLAGTGVAAGGVPEILGLNATPKRFCATKTATCQRVGTRITFVLPIDAKVRVDVIPRSGAATYGFMELNRRLQAGARSVRIKDGRMQPGRWDVRVQGTGAVGTGPISVVRVRVVKHD